MMARRALLMMGLMTAGVWHSTPAHAAPFCIEITGMTPECSYADPADCRKRAKQLNALCTLNPAEVKLKPGSQRYCIVTSQLATQCMYDDFQTCDVEAGRKGAICADSGPPGQQQDMFRTEPDRRY